MRTPRLTRTVLLCATLALLASCVLPVAAGAHIRDGHYRVKTKDIGIAAGGTGGGKVRCPAGQRVVSGGAYFHLDGQGPTPEAISVLRYSTPLADGTGWRAGGRNPGSLLVLTIVITCLPLSVLGPYTVVHKDVGAPVGGTKGGWVDCPGAMRAVTGGAYWHRPGQGPNPALEAYLGSSGTGDLLTWYASGTTSLLNVSLRVTALCLPKAKVGSPALVYQDLGTDGGNVGAYLACPPGRRLVAGGVISHPVSQGADPTRGFVVQDSTPTTDALGWWGSGRSLTSGMQLRLVAWCATPRV